MKKILSMALVWLAFATTATAQQTERKEPVVNWGIRAEANLTGFVMTNVPTMPDLTARPEAGGDVGGFINFNISRHFVVQFGLQGFYENSTIVNGDVGQLLSSAGLEVPVALLWRIGSERIGWFTLGGGPYTAFVLWGRIENGTDIKNPYGYTITDDETGTERAIFADSHSGIGVHVGYELPNGFQLVLTARHALGDMLLFEHGKGSYVLPWKLTLGIGYRF